MTARVYTTIKASSSLYESRKQAESLSQLLRNTSKERCPKMWSRRRPLQSIRKLRPSIARPSTSFPSQNSPSQSPVNMLVGTEIYPVRPQLRTCHYIFGNRAPITQQDLLHSSSLERTSHAPNANNVMLTNVSTGNCSSASLVPSW